MTETDKVEVKEQQVDKEVKSNPEQNKFLGKRNIYIGIILVLLTVILILVFFWQHLVAVTGLKMWSSHAGGKPIDCMMRDTNDDQYISCTAMVNEQIVPLECGVSIFNIGCRVNYGTASPQPLKPKPKP
jgi:hypothetical protein